MPLIIIYSFFLQITYQLDVVKTINEKSSLLDSINKRKQVLYPKMPSASQKDISTTATTLEPNTSTEETNDVHTTVKCVSSKKVSPVQSNHKVSPKKTIKKKEENKLTACKNNVLEKQSSKSLVSSQSAPVLKVLLNKLSDKKLPTNTSTTQGCNASKKYNKSLVKSLVEDQPLLQPIVKRRRKSIYATYNDISEHTSDTNKARMNYSKNIMDEIDNNGDSDTNTEQSIILNDIESKSKNMSITEILKDIIGINSDQILVDFNNEDDANGIILSTGDIIDAANAKDTTSVELKTKMNMVAAVEEMERDNVILENKNYNNIVTTEIMATSTNVNAEIEKSNKHNQTLNTVEDCAMQSNDDRNVTETDTSSLLVLDNSSANIEATACFTVSDTTQTDNENLPNYVDLGNQEECFVKNQNTNVKDTLLERSRETETPQALLRENQINTEDCIVQENVIRINYSDKNIVDMAEVAVTVETNAIDFIEATVEGHTSMKLFKSKKTPMQKEKIKGSDKGVTVEKQNVGNKAVSCLVEDGIENNKLNDHHESTMQCVADNDSLINKLDSIDKSLQISIMENTPQRNDNAADVVQTEGSENVSESKTCTLVQTYPVSLGEDNNKTLNPTQTSQQCERKNINKTVNNAKNELEINEKNNSFTPDYATTHSNNINNKEQVATLDISHKSIAVIQYSTNPINVVHDKQSGNNQQETSSLSKPKLRQYSAKRTKVVQPTSNIAKKSIISWNDKFIMTHTDAKANLIEGQMNSPAHQVLADPIESQTLPCVNIKNSDHTEKYCVSKRNTNVDKTKPLVFDVIDDIFEDNENEDLAHDIILEQVNEVIAKLDKQLMTLEHVSNNTKEPKCYEGGSFIYEDLVLENVPLPKIGKNKNGEVGALNPTTNQVNLLSNDNYSNLKKTVAKNLCQHVDENKYSNINHELLSSKHMVTEKLGSVCEAVNSELQKNETSKERKNETAMKRSLGDESPFEQIKRRKIATERQLIIKMEKDKRIKVCNTIVEECFVDSKVQTEVSYKESPSLESTSISEKKTEENKQKSNKNKTKTLRQKNVIGNKVLKIVLERLPETITRLK